MKKYLAAVPAVLFTGAAFAAGPSAGDLSGLVPDAATILVAIMGVGTVIVGVTLALRSFGIINTQVKKVG